MLTDRATSLLMGTANVPNAKAEHTAAIQPHISQEAPPVSVIATTSTAAALFM